MFSLTIKIEEFFNLLPLAVSHPSPLLGHVLNVWRYPRYDWQPLYRRNYNFRHALNENLTADMDCTLELKFGVPSLKDVVLPEPKLYANDGYISELSKKGHGLQRMAIFSLLRTYYNFDFDDADGGSRNVIIGIEEPEIYLHPPVKRSTYKLLKDIASGKDQVLYTTHDNYFVSVEFFDEIRLFKKLIPVEGGPITEINEFSIEDLIKFYQENYNITIPEESLRHKYYHIFDETKNESFFSKKVILIEGGTEKYALPTYFSRKGFDLDSNRYSIVTAGSVTNITYLYLILSKFKIPCYIVFDGDSPDNIDALTGDHRKNAIEKSKRNKEIFDLAGIKYEDSEFFFPETNHYRNCTVWNKNFENEFHNEFANYDQLKGSAKKLYATDSKPLTARFISENCDDSFPEKVDSHIKQMIKNIEDL